MGRKRLLTLLAALVAAVGLQVGPAAALDVDTDDGCVESSVDLGLIALDPKLCVSPEDGVSLDGGATVDDTTVDIGKATQPVEDVVNDVIATKAPKDEPDPEPAPPTRDPGSDPAPDRGSSAPPPAVAPAGRADTFDPDAERERIASLRAIEADLAARSLPEHGVQGPVGPGVADLGRIVVPDVAPSVAPRGEVRSVEPDSQDALLAARDRSEPLGDAPLALKLLASSLVLAAGAVWLIAQREYGTVPVSGR